MTPTTSTKETTKFVHFGSYDELVTMLDTVEALPLVKSVIHCAVAYRLSNETMAPDHVMAVFSAMISHCVEMMGKEHADNVADNVPAYIRMLIPEPGAEEEVQNWLKISEAAEAHNKFVNDMSAAVEFDPAKFFSQ